MPKILIIDDDEDIVESMRIVLESGDYRVESASSGQEGLEKAGRNKPDLVILDVMMESKDKGFEVARDLKKGNCRDVPILMLTAIQEKMGMDFKAQAGDPDWLPVDYYVDKPLKPEELLGKVGSILRNK